MRDSDRREARAGPDTALFWRREKATRAGLIVDAKAYFEVGRKAMLKARRRIMLIGWDFDARIELSDERLPGEPRTLGEFVLWLVKRNPELEVFLLRWNIGALKALFRGTTIFTLMRWMAHPPHPHAARQCGDARRLAPSQDRRDRRLRGLLRRHRHDQQPLGHA